MLYLISVILLTLGLGAGLCWIFFVINKENQALNKSIDKLQKENQALNKSIDKLQSEVNALFNQSIQPVYNISDSIKDGVNTKTYMGDNVWKTTLIHEGRENTAIGSCAGFSITDCTQNSTFGILDDKKKKILEDAGILMAERRETNASDDLVERCRRDKP